MKKQLLTYFICLPILLSTSISIAQNSCYFKDTLLSIDFGSAYKQQEFNLSSLKNYRRDYTVCPNDGYYSYSDKTGNCFNGDWITLDEDHTPNDMGGKMMVVNASEKAGIFFIATLAGFKPGTNYEFSSWLLNICKINSGCSPLPPNIQITLETLQGIKIVSFNTGQLFQSDFPSWKRYFGLFSTPADASSLILKMTNTTNGGCGNDFAMDDIYIRECYPIPPPAASMEKPVAKPLPRTVDEKRLPVVIKEQAPVKKDIQTVKRLPTADPVVKNIEINRPTKVIKLLPKPILTRANPVIKEIEVAEGEILIEIYDNGIIDGDTISVYINNELVVSKTALSAKPISLKLRIDEASNYHELIMVAENLGSIPPNTSLMVVTTAGKRYEVFISSSEQKNAKIIIKRK